MINSTIGDIMKKISLLLLSLTLLFTSLYANDENRGLKKIYGERRIALVIGNGNYDSSPLKNPANDAEDMTKILNERGFAVTSLIDSDRRTMVKAIHTFGQDLQKGGVGLFYYAGHGMQVNGRNYLIPIGATIEVESDIEFESVDVGRVLASMANASNRLNMVILDACRDNPFARSFRSSSKGLAQMDAPTGTLIAYATAPGRTAADGGGRNGIYTKYLLEQATVPGVEVSQMFRRVRVRVQQETGGQQTPWESTSLTGDFYFTPDGQSDVALSPPPVFSAPPPTPPKNNHGEREMWELVKGSEYIQDIEEFLRSFPDGHYQKAAELKLKQLKQEKSNQSQENFEKAKSYYDDGKYRVALSHFKLAAKDGHVEAHTWLGFMYRTGQGMVPDQYEAMKWYRKAAQQGSTEAQRAIIAAEN